MDDDMSEEALKEIEKRAEAATKGPWQRCEANEGKCPCAGIWSRSLDRPLFSIYPTHDGVASAPHREWDSQDYANMDFCASARADVPTLLAEVRKLRRERLALAEECERLKNGNADAQDD